MLRSVRTPVSILAVLAVAGAALLSGFSSIAEAQRGGLAFSKPVALNSFSPVRTIEGDVYSAEDGNSPPGHEWSGEPVINVDNKGVIYVGGTCCLGAASPAWYSKDGGKTFQE